MADAEVQKLKLFRDGHQTKCAAIGLGGFIISVFFIYWSLIVLVRFYVFDNAFYNLFLLCMMGTGIIFNITSINFLLVDFVEPNFLHPFLIGSPITLFWTILSIFLPIFKENFYSQFAFMPIALYDSSFYDGLGHNPNETTVHPFAKPFITENSFFENTLLILVILVIAALAQLVLWLFSIIFFYQLKKEGLQMKMMCQNGESSNALR